MLRVEAVSRFRPSFPLTVDWISDTQLPLSLRRVGKQSAPTFSSTRHGDQKLPQLPDASALALQRLPFGIAHIPVDEPSN